MATGSGIRIGDAERNALAENLREHYAAGRLTMEEFQERLDAAFAAKTDLDVDKLTEDLPHSISYTAPWPPRADGSLRVRPQGGGRRQAPSGSRSWMGALAGVVAVISFFVLATVVILWLPFGGLPKTVLLVLAVFAFIRRVLRRVMLGRRR